jgi:hypothetical protein
VKYIMSDCVVGHVLTPAVEPARRSPTTAQHHTADSIALRLCIFFVNVVWGSLC